MHRERHAGYVIHSYIYLFVQVRFSETISSHDALYIGLEEEGSSSAGLCFDIALGPESFAQSAPYFGRRLVRIFFIKISTQIQETGNLASKVRHTPRKGFRAKNSKYRL